MRLHYLFIFLFWLNQGFICKQDFHGPDIINQPYGPYEKNVFDLWKAPSDTPTPLVVFIHGGGFSSGSKEKISSGLVYGLLQQGISVMAINYRLTPDAVFPEHYKDCARAIQNARYHAKEFNIDPSRISAMGGSAGACISMWIGFHDDLADLNNTDPVLRMSTRLSSIISINGQTTLIPDTIRKWFGDIVMKHSFMKGAFFGITPEQMNTPLAHELFSLASPITYLTKDDPPVWAYYSSTDTPTNTSEAIHHLNFGLHLKERMDMLGIAFTLHTPANTLSPTKESIEFLRRNFGMKNKD